MGTRVQTLKSIFTAETRPAEAGFSRMQAVTASFQQAAGGAFDGLGVGLKQFAGAAGVGAAVVAIGKGALAANSLREQFGNTQRQLGAYAGSQDAARAATEAMVRATEGGVSRLSAMQMAGQMLGMGLANTATQVGTMARMATLLGDKTLTVEERMANWNAMMANQSLPRLDTYGISSGRVRQKIDELMAANAGLSREQAFTNAVLEIGGEKLRSLETSGVQAAGGADKVSAAWENLKQAAANRVNLDVFLNVVANTVQGAANAVAYEPVETPEMITDRAQAMGLVEDATVRVSRAQGEYNDAIESGRKDYIEYTKAQLDAAEAELYAAETLLHHEDAVRIATVSAYEYSGSMLEVADVLAQVHAQVNAEFLASLSALTSELDNAGDAAIRSSVWLGEFKNAATQTAAAQMQDTYGDAQDYIGPSQMEANKAAADRKIKALQDADEVARRGAQTWGRSMDKEVTDFQGQFSGAMQGAISDSKGLLDLTPGGEKGPNAPGANGFAENIYRLQAFVNDGTWSQTASQFGLDKAGATDVVKKFQSGMWDESVLKVLDMDKLKKQIKDQQVAKGMMDQLAADLAAETQGDPKIIKAMLGMGGGSDGAKGQAAAATGMDMSSFVPGLLAGLDKVLAENAADIEKRGGIAGDSFGKGFVKKLADGPYLRDAVFKLVDERFVENLE